MHTKQFTKINNLLKCVILVNGFPKNCHEHQLIEKMPNEQSIQLGKKNSTSSDFSIQKAINSTQKLQDHPDFQFFKHRLYPIDVTKLFKTHQLKVKSSTNSPGTAGGNISRCGTCQRITDATDSSCRSTGTIPCIF